MIQNADYLDFSSSRIFNLILTDPPYGLTNASWDKKIDLKRFWNFCDSNLAKNGQVVVFGAQPFTSDLISSNKNWFKYSVIWEKSNATGFLNAKKRPLSAHEDVCVFWRTGEKPAYNPQMTTGHKRKTSSRTQSSELYGDTEKKIIYDSTDRYPRSVLKFPSDKQKLKYHSTQKPEALMEWLVKTYSNEGDFVLDPFMGSGTTGVASIRMNREFTGIEIDKKFFETAKLRLDSIK